VENFVNVGLGGGKMGVMCEVGMRIVRVVRLVRVGKKNYVAGT